MQNGFLRSLFFLLALSSFVFVPHTRLLAEPEEYGLSNAPLPTAEVPEQETIVILPDGRRVNPWLVLPEGWLVSDDGKLITDDGVIIHRDGHFEYPFGALPEGYETRPDGSLVLPSGIVLPKPGKPALAAAPTSMKNPEEKKEGREQPRTRPLEPVAPKPKEERIKPVAPTAQEVPVITPQRPVVSAPVVTPQRPAVSDPQGPVQLWSMLPLSEVPGKPKSEKPKREGKPEASQPKPQEKPEAKAQEKPKEKPKAKPDTPKSEPPKEKRRPKIGEELSIPKESLKTGNLDFLEGCWQGTRPEYYSKRTIYECFCFGKQGKNGKRRVIDPQGGRRCVGGTQARLGGNGVLYVQSQGAVCSDGERWGQAEMTCRGKGQHTPCSWVFRDANGGRQSYEIPFVRVEKCGRR